MAFKTKTKTRLLIDERQTLDAKHNNILNSFTTNKETLANLYSELNNITTKLNELTIENSKSPMFNIEIQKIIWFYDDKKNEIEINIHRIENNIDENDYMLNTGKLISNYYKIINEEKNITLSDTKIQARLETNKVVNTEVNTNTNTNTNTDSNIYTTISNTTTNLNKVSTKHKHKNITDWFNNDNDNDNEQEHEKEHEQALIHTHTHTHTHTQSQSPKDITDGQTLQEHVTSRLQSKQLDDLNAIRPTQNTMNTHMNTKLEHTSSFKENDENNFKNNINKYKNQKTQTFMHQSKDIIYDKYMKLIDKNYISTINTNKDIFDNCTMCNIEMLLNNNTGQLTCPNCGFIENIIVDSDKPSFKEPPKEMTSFCYKRINHLNEFLAQFQAKETTDIPESVYNDIIMEIKKERIKNMAVITPDKMRTILKKIKKNDYYEHIPYIINQLNGLPAPVIAPEIEEIIRGMFKAIQIPFEKYCPFKRKNFLSYNYVMYKFFELLELDEYLTCFQLLKSRTKLHQQDQIWKNICKDLNWQYINSL